MLSFVVRTRMVLMIAGITLVAFLATAASANDAHASTYGGGTASASASSDDLGRMSHTGAMNYHNGNDHYGSHEAGFGAQANFGAGMGHNSYHGGHMGGGSGYSGDYQHGSSVHGGFDGGMNGGFHHQGGHHGGRHGGHLGGFHSAGSHHNGGSAYGSAGMHANGHFDAHGGKSHHGSGSGSGGKNKIAKIGGVVGGVGGVALVGKLIHDHKKHGGSHHGGSSGMKGALVAGMAAASVGKHGGHGSHHHDHHDYGVYGHGSGHMGAGHYASSGGHYPTSKRSGLFGKISKGGKHHHGEYPMVDEYHYASSHKPSKFGFLRGHSKTPDIVERTTTYSDSITKLRNLNKKGFKLF